MSLFVGRLVEKEGHLHLGQLRMRLHAQLRDDANKALVEPLLAGAFHGCPRPAADSLQLPLFESDPAWAGSGVAVDDFEFGVEYLADQSGIIRGLDASRLTAHGHRFGDRL